MQADILISIVTPCLNRADYIVEAVESVVRQDYKFIEHIIMDGGSTDGTLELLANYQHLKVFSKKEKGLYDAINKGLELVEGEIVGLLNSDDYYEPNIFGTIIRLFLENPEIGAICGKAIVFINDNQGHQQVVKNYSAITEEQLYYRVTQGTPIINAWFFRKSIFDIIGSFDIRYLFSSDRDWMIRLAIKKPNILSLDKLVYHYRQHPQSLTLDGKYDIESEHNYESIDIARHYMGDSTLPSSLQGFLEEWYIDIAITRIYSAIITKDIGKALRIMFIVMRQSPNWFRIIFERTIQKISKKRSFGIELLD